MRKQPGYGILLGLTITATVLAVVTALPVNTHGPNALGYASVCPWMPWSTALLLGLAATSCKLRSKLFKSPR